MARYKKRDPESPRWVWGNRAMMLSGLGSSTILGTGEKVDPPRKLVGRLGSNLGLEMCVLSQAVRRWGWWGEGGGEGGGGGGWGGGGVGLG